MIDDDLVEFGEEVGFEGAATYFQGGFGEFFEDLCEGVEEGVVALDAAEVAEGDDAGVVGWGGGGEVLPGGEVEAVVDDGDAVGGDAVDLGGVAGDLGGDGEDVVGEVAQTAIGGEVLGRAEDAHVAAVPDKAGGGEEAGDGAGPDVGGLEEGFDEADALAAEETAEGKGAAEGAKVPGAGEGEEVDGAGWVVERGGFGVGGEGEDGSAIAEGGEVLGLAEDDALTAAEAVGELVDDEQDVGEGGRGGVEGPG